MESFGLIIPTALPGWHFGDTLIGKWKINKSNYLVLTLGDNEDSYTSFYKIIKFTKDRLTIGQTNENNGEPFLKIEFVRQ